MANLIDAFELTPVILDQQTMSPVCYIAFKYNLKAHAQESRLAGNVSDEAMARTIGVFVLDRLKHADRKFGKILSQEHIDTIQNNF